MTTTPRRDRLEQRGPPVVGRTADPAAPGRQGARSTAASTDDASARTTFDRVARPVRDRLVLTASTDSRDRSTNVAWAAPRDSASMPSAPEPANRSSTVASSITPIDPSALNVASLTRSDVGRTARPSVATRWIPRAVPATTLTGLRR